MPFLAAYLIAAILQPLVRLISKKTKLDQRIVSFAVTILFYCTIGALMFVICAEAVSFARSIFSKLPQFYSSTIEPMFNTVISAVSELPESFDPTIAAAIGKISSNLLSYAGSIVSTLSSAVLTYVSGIAMSLPTLVLKVIFTVVSSFYFTSDHDLINKFFEKQIGENSYEKFRTAKSAVRDIIFSYAKSYAIILVITFAELTVALLILQVPGAVLLALLIALFDILPVVGTGTILWPWAVIELLNGQYGTAVGLIITYIVIFIIRNMIEPKIVGRGVGLHPLVTLLAMFVGTMLFGVIGLFGVPIMMALIVDLNEKGIIKVFSK